MNPFEIVESVSEHKKIDFEDKDYNAFLINRALSYFSDSILYANEMNKLSHIPHQQQYDFYFETLRPRKRRAKWAKEIKDNNEEIIAKYYNLSSKKAKEVINILSALEIKNIAREMNKGGKNDI